MLRKLLSICGILLFCCLFKAAAQQTTTDTTAGGTTPALKKANLITPNVVTPPNGQNSINTPSLTNVLPAAPNAFELTRYSGLPVNMATGSVSTKIPLGDVKSGKVDVPIQLNYNSGNGILMNQTASRTGMSWTLEAGGVITRSVRGNPDELSRWLNPPAPGTPSRFNNQDAALYNYLNYAQQTLDWDTQVDLFSFNFNGYSGQFYLDPKDTTASGNRVKAVLVDQSNLKIETNFHGEFTSTDNWTIRITDPQGTKYYFGGLKATETSKTSPYGGGCGKNFNIPWATAWYLKAVQHYTGEYVWLDYTPISFEYFTDVTQTMIRTPGTGAGYACSSACPTRTEDQICYSRLQSTGYLLKQISSKFVKVKFSYIGRNDLPGDSLVTSVEFFNKGLTDTTSLTSFNKYDLAYTTGFNSTYYNNNGNSSFLGYRPFLTSVTRSASGMAAQVHQMSYYNINSLASRLSFAQDYWGYFNGANNTNFIPANTDSQVAPYFPTANANREPNGSFAYYGLLNKITYPTKGTDSLVYEPNTIWETRQDHAGTYVVKTATGTGDTGETDVTFPFNIYADQNITLNISCPYSGTGLNDLRRQHLIVSIIASDNTVEFNQLVKVDSTYSQSLHLSAGNYTLKLQAYGQAAAGSVTMYYKIALPPVTTNYQVGGVRLLKNISTPLLGPTLVKKYVYAALTSQAQSSGRVRRDSDPSDYYSTLTDGKGCPDLSIGLCTYFIAYSNPIHSLNYFSGSNINYNNVIELQGEQWANGGIEHQYAFAGVGSDALLVMHRLITGVPLSNGGYPIGLETLKQTFFTTGGTEGSHTYKVVNQVATHYTSDTRLMKFADNYVVRMDWTLTEWGTPPLPSQFDPYDVSYYDITAQWIYPDTVTTTNYDLAGNNPVVTKQYDVYNNASNLMVSEKHTIGSDGLDQKMVYSYPHEMVAAGSMIPYQSMINANDIAPVVEQTFYKNNVLLQGLKSNYGDFGNGVYEPDSIQTKTTGNYDTRINFYSYNINGGLLSQGKTYGPKNSYIWGYNNLFPVAEAKNAAPNEIFYEGFEYTTTTDTTHHTGKRSNHAAYTVSFTPPVGKTYLISWFQLNGSKWDYHNETYTGSKAFTAANYVDDISVYPSDALMTTYAYTPHIGMSGGIDAKGQTTTYDYDNYQRLQNIRDLYGNIVKNYTYNYNTANPTVYYNAVQTQNFTTHCSVGYGSTVAYTVNAGSYSSSISQADADAQAMAEVNDKGQEYADAQGSCTTSIQLQYYNSTPLSGSTHTGHVTQLQIKNSAGTVLYTFTEAQLTVGQTITPGTYTLVYTTSGPVFTFGTNTGWATLETYAGSYDSLINNTGATSYTVTNVPMTSGSPWTIALGTGAE
ncbi:MAG: DUF5977 domain-containing protein [Bacteroidota bacterium]|nr:DUF5977 domain-containing protein [Bacteroidota bacterium]